MTHSHLIFESICHAYPGPSLDIINDTLIAPSDVSNNTYIAVEPAISIHSPIDARIAKLEYHMNLMSFTIEDVPGDGACFFHALLIELHHHNYPAIAETYTAFSLRDQVCNFLLNHTGRCCPVDCALLDFVVRPEQYGSFENFVNVMRKYDTYAEHLLIYATHVCLEINIVIIHDIREECTTMVNESYMTTVTLGNLENYHFVPIIDQRTAFV